MARTSGACRRTRWRPSATRRIGFVFQFASLLPTLRLIDNVALPAMLGKRQPAAEVYARASGLLGRMGLRDYLDAYPSEVSAGEQRRAVIARALINDPALVLADEPTADLDEQTEIEIMDELLARQPRERHDADPGDPQSFAGRAGPSRSSTSPTARLFHE